MSQREKHFKRKEKVLGQFFTPPDVAEFIVRFGLMHLDRERYKKGCDPACGDGVFLQAMINAGIDEVIGMDIDENCLKNIPLYVRERAKILIGDALLRVPTLDGSQFPLPENYFDLVVGNPPFSAKYGRVTNEIVLRDYELGHGMRSQAIEVLFLERFIQLTKPGGIIGIILPDGIFLNLNYRRVREFLLTKCRVLAVISLPRGIFNSTKSTASKTSILFAIKDGPHRGEVFMAEVTNIRELRDIIKLYENHKTSASARWVNIQVDSLHPKTYLWPALPQFRFPTKKLGELINEIRCGATEYGSKRRFSDAGIRFISAKVVTSLGLDFTRDNRRFVKPGSPMDKKRAHTKKGDVLFVRVGVGCIGRAAVVIDEHDVGIADDWIYIIRVKEGEISPYYLALFLQTKYGKIQIDKAKRGVGTVTIPQKLLKEIIVPVPPQEFQKPLEERYTRMVYLMRAKRYDEAEKIFKNLIKKLENELVEQEHAHNEQR